MKQLKNPILKDLFNKGLKKLRSNNADKAASYFQQIITSDPKNADAHFYLGLALRALGKINQSQISLERSAELNPRSSEIHYQLSLTHLINPVTRHSLLLQIARLQCYK